MALSYCPERGFQLAIAIQGDLKLDGVGSPSFLKGKGPGSYLSSTIMNMIQSVVVDES